MIDSHPGLQAELAAQRQKLGTTLFGRTEVNLLEPSPGVAIQAGLGRAAP
jgi:hypothetical protein